MNTVSDHHDLYLKTDVSFLADVFEKFVSSYLEYYGLDLCHYFRSSGLSWDAVKRWLKLELISNIGMYLFVGKKMRGGISYISKRYSKANNKYMKLYDDSKPSKYIMYLDANSLYSWTMSQYLPYCKFIWLNKKIW